MDNPSLKKIRISRKNLEKLNDEFLRSLRNRKPQTRGTYQRALREFFRWHRASDSFRFQVSDVERYKLFLAKEKQLSDVSVSAYLTALRRFCGFLVKKKILHDNPARFVNGNKRPAKHSRDFLSREEAEALMNVIPREDLKGTRDFAMVKLMLQCALSEVEIVQADIGDCGNEDGREILNVQGKGRREKDQKVFLSDDARVALDAYLSRRRSEHSEQKKISGESPLFISTGNRSRGRRISSRSVRHRVNHYLMLAGLKNDRVGRVTPFSLRHTAAMRMVEDGLPPEEIRQRLRLGSLATAMVYINEARS